MAALLVAVAVALCLLGAVAGQCDYYQEIEVGQSFDIKSPGYPSNYPAGTRCQWRGAARQGNKLSLECKNFNIPSSSGCQQDRVLVSPSGGVVPNDQHTYCGQGSFTVTSDSNLLTMTLQASSNSRGGVFLCTITAISSSSCNCGWKKQTRIVGGTETGVNEFPMMAALIDLENRRLYCGATIISTLYALSAAHCMLNKLAIHFALLVGDHDISTGNETSASKLLLIARFIGHPEYNSATQANDIGLVQVKDTIPFSANILPACLPFKYVNNDFSGQIVKVLGWGTTEFGGPTSDKLLQADLSVITYSKCRETFEDAVTSKQLCTFRNGKDACQSDSGGPVLWKDPSTNRLHLVAVISYGVSCATETPGVNTRITSYLSWITQTTGDGYCRV